MKKIFPILLLFCLCCLSCEAQLTAVSGIVQDSTGQLWKNGNYKIDFIRNPNQVGITPLFNGSSFLEHYNIAPLDNTAAFSISLPPVTSITPSGGLWNFQFCPNATASCTSFTVAVQGATLNLSAIITSFIKVPTLNGSPVLNKAYGDTELRTSVFTPNSQATLYYDVTLNCIKYFDGSIWQCVGNAGPGTVSITATLPIVVAPNPITNTGDISCPTCITSLPPDVDFYQTMQFTVPGPVTTTMPQRSKLRVIQSTNMTVTMTDNVGNDSTDLTLSSASGGGPDTISFDQCSPDQSNAPGNSYWIISPPGVGTWDFGHWEFLTGVAGDIFCSVRITNNFSLVTPHIILDFETNDNTAGHQNAIQTCDVVTSSNISVSPASCATSQFFTTTATAYDIRELSFNVQSALTLGQYLIVKIIVFAGTIPTNVMMMPPKVKIQ